MSRSQYGQGRERLVVGKKIYAFLLVGFLSVEFLLQQVSSLSLSSTRIDRMRLAPSTLLLRHHSSKLAISARTPAWAPLQSSSRLFAAHTTNINLEPIEIPVAVAVSGVVASENNHTNRNKNNMTAQEEHVDKTFTPYQQLVRKLYKTNWFRPVNLGLENMEQMHELLGNPTDDIPVIHIAGTNGKGSVALKIAKTLEASSTSSSSSNLNVGLFLSPHITTFRERMQINGTYITEEEVLEYLPQVYKIVQDHDIPATFFEITTALAFHYFAKKNADVIVLETGLGGRLDATNVVKQPALSVITSIGLEHTSILGETIPEIALEKGGIMKSQRPVLCGPNVPHDVLKKCAIEKQVSQYYTVDDVLRLEDKTNDSDEITTMDYDQENTRTAKAALQLFFQESKLISELTPAMIQQGTSQRPPCRFETITAPNGVTVIMDVAHNPQAIDYLIHKLKSKYHPPPERNTRKKNIRFVVGMSADKDLKQCAQSLLQATGGMANAIHLVQAAHPRAATLENILQAEPILKDQGAHFDFKDRSISPQVNRALEFSLERDEILVVCGSVFLMAEAREALGLDNGGEVSDADCIADLTGENMKHGQEKFVTQAK